MTTFDLFSSVRDGNTEIVRRLLQSKQCRARLNDRNEWGDTALHLAAEAGNAEICQMLIAAGASITVRNNRGETCLHRAAVGGHVEAVRAIVGRDQDPEAVNSQNDAGYTALHHAAKHGSKDLIEILVKADADRMIENNAGEAPYMVAHKFQQWEAERLLLNVEQEHADRAVREMNRKEKDIIRAYMRATKQASHIESRVRIILIGDRGTGKTSLKKTLFGEPYNVAEKPTSSVHADPSITRIQFKQYREWVLPVASKSDTHRLNLEYLDIIIDYVLKLLQQPRISDDGVDPACLQIKKDQVKTVNFNSNPDIIPDVEGPEDGDEEEGGGEGEEGEGEEGEGEGKTGEAGSAGGADVESGGDNGSEPPAEPAVNSTSEVPNNSEHEVDKSEVRSRQPETKRGSPSEIVEVSVSPEHSTDTSNDMDVALSPIDDDSDTEGSSITARAAMHSPTLVRRLDGLHQISISNDSAPQEGAEFEDDRLRRFAQECESMEPPSDTYTSSSSVATPSVTDRSQNTSDSSRGTNLEDSQQPSLGSSTNALHSKSTSKGSMFQPVAFHHSRGVLSRLLIEKIPREILKRMVIRWPVGEETPRDRSEFNRKRLMITVWDVSGDVIQQNFTPFFFSDRCIYVAAYNLARRLEGPCESISALDLRNVDGSFPTNAEVLEDWMGCVTAFSKDVPMQQQRCTKQTPVLPPVIFACTSIDNESVRETPYSFHQFFDRKSFDSYKRHLMEGSSPTALGISNLYEYECEEGYSGHHLLRREIDYLARQMPYVWDDVPVQWVKFEQLVYGLQEQRKVILLYTDLEKYVSDHCQITGPLQVLPVLSHYHDVGVITFFYRHPELCKIVITKPQWLADALGTVITSNPGRWVTGDVQNAFSKLHQEGSIGKDMLHLAYRCARMPHRYWNEMVFILNCMNLITCHPSLHAEKAVFLPAMVTQVATEPFFAPTERDPAVLHFSTQNAAIPVALYNQLVVTCIRNSPYQPVLRYHQAHLQLSETHHLVLAKHQKSISFVLQEGCEQFCPWCKDTERYDDVQECAVLAHLLGEDTEYMPSDNIATLVETAGRPSSMSRLKLELTNGVNSLKSLCPSVLRFLTKNIQFLCHCWFPGLNLELITYRGDETVVLDQYWRHTSLCTGQAPSCVCMWFIA